MVGDALTRRGRPKQRNVEIVFMVGVDYGAADESKDYRESSDRDDLRFLYAFLEVDLLEIEREDHRL
jgi:hypothetical protein